MEEVCPGGWIHSLPYFRMQIPLIPMSYSVIGMCPPLEVQRGHHESPWCPHVKRPQSCSSPEKMYTDELHHYSQYLSGPGIWQIYSEHVEEQYRLLQTARTETQCKATWPKNCDCLPHQCNGLMMEHKTRWSSSSLDTYSQGGSQQEANHHIGDCIGTFSGWSLG